MENKSFTKYKNVAPNLRISFTKNLFFLVTKNKYLYILNIFVDFVQEMLYLVQVLLSRLIKLNWIVDVTIKNTHRTRKEVDGRQRWQITGRVVEK